MLLFMDVLEELGLVEYFDEDWEAVPSNILLSLLH